MIFIENNINSSCHKAAYRSFRAIDESRRWLYRSGSRISERLGI